LALLSSGDLIAGGSFSSLDGQATERLARWNGVAWGPFSPSWSITSSAALRDIACLLALPNGRLLLGGYFDAVSGVPASNVALWDGSQWQPLASGTSNTVRCAARLADGSLVLGGDFLFAGGLACGRIARWDGSAFHALGAGMGPFFFARVDALLATATELLVGGTFTSAGATLALGVAAWNGSTWSSLGSGLTQASGTAGAAVAFGALPGNAVLVGGVFDRAGGVPASRLARWSAAGWSEVGTGTSDRIHCLLPASDGSLYAGGNFLRIGGTPANFVARRVAGQWQAFGPSLNSGVSTILELPNGEIWLGGAFTEAGGSICRRVARWDGVSLQQVGNGLDAPVVDLVQRIDGAIFAAGSFISISTAPVAGLARWDGAAWQPVPMPIGWRCNRVLALPSGELAAAIVGPSGGSVSSFVATWDGSSWTQLPPIAGGPLALLALADGSLSADGMRWDGSSWQPLAPGLAGRFAKMLLLPNGDVLASGALTLVGSPTAVCRWNGASWSPFPGLDDSADAMAIDAEGALVFGGVFRRAGSSASPFLANFDSGCLAAAETVLQGCAGSLGPVTLRTTSLPWLGGTARALAAGFSANALPVAVLGFTVTSVPLASLLPQGLPGCELGPVPIVFQTLANTGGTAAVALAIPPTSTLLATSLVAQVLPCEVAAGALQSVAASPTVRWTVGTL
jgi:trimeric autotransporter adhesin